MAKPRQKRILLVGDESSVSRLGAPSAGEWEIELVGSIAEAAARQASRDYAKTVIDPAALETTKLEVLAPSGAMGEVRLGAPQPHEDSETALPGSEWHLRQALGETFAGTWEWNARTDELRLSPESYELYGMEPGQRPPTAAEWRSRIHPEDLPGVEQAVHDALEGITPGYRAEFRVRHRERGERWIMGVGRIERAGDGSLLGASGANIDITDRKRDEEELRRGRELLQTVLDTVPTGVVLADAQGNITYFSPAAVPIFGGPVTGTAAGPAPGSYKLLRNDGTPFAPGEFPLVRSIRENRGIEDMEIQVMRADGTTATILANTMPVHDARGRVTGAVASLQDITGRKKANDALESEGARLRAILDAMPTGVWIADADGNILETNDQARAIWGGSSRAADVTGRNVDYRTWRPGTGERVPKEQWPMHRAIRGESVMGEETNIQRFDGSYGTILDNAAPILDSDGRIIGGVVVEQDITERKKAEEALRENEEYLRLFIEHAPVALALFDTQMRYISASKRWMSDYGLTGNVIGRSHYEVFPEIEERWKAVHRRCLAGATERAEEDRFVRANGRVQWQRWEILPWRKADSTIGGIVVFTEDITQRKQAEESLQKYQLLSQHSRDIVLFVNRYGAAIIEANDAAANAYGYTRDELLSLTILNLRAVPDVDEVERQMAEADAHGIRFETRHRRKDGSVFDVEVSSRGADIGGSRVLMSIVRDITGRKQAEEALRESEERLRLLGDNLPGSAVYQYTHGDDGAPRFVYISSGIERLSGVKPEDVVRDHRTLHDQVLPEYYPALLEAEAASKRDLTDFNMDLQMRRPDGEVRWMKLSSRPKLMPDGRVIWNGVQTDITESKRAEKRLEDLLSRERRIAETLQQALVPPQIPAHAGDYSFYVIYQPALREAEVGGDFYDVFALGDDKFGVLIGDVTGKGLAAAVQVAAVRYAVRGYAYIDPRPSRVLTLVNEAICRDEFNENRMLTAVFAVIDARLGTLVYCSAGHEPSVAVSQTGIAAELPTTGVPIGVSPGMPYTEQSLRLDEYARIVMLTDGIPEARSPRTGMWEKQNVLDYLARTRSLPAPLAAAGLVEAAMDHAQGSLQDDAAVLVIERTPG